jgi:hypothetical protein
MAIYLAPNGLKEAGGYMSVYPDGHVNTASQWCIGGFGYSTATNGHTRADGTMGWTHLGSTQGPSAQGYPTMHYKLYDHNNNYGPGGGDTQYLLFYDGDSNYANGGLYWLRLEHWYTSNPNRVSGFSCTCINGEPVGIYFTVNETAGNEEIWVRGSRSWGNLYIMRIAGQSGAITNSGVCAWYNNGPIASSSTQPSGTKVRGANFCYDLEGNSFRGMTSGETW